MIPGFRKKRQELKQRKQITLVSKRKLVSKDNILTQVFSVSAASNGNLFEQLFPPCAKDFPRSESTCAATRFPFISESSHFGSRVELLFIKFLVVHEAKGKSLSISDCLMAKRPEIYTLGAAPINDMLWLAFITALVLLSFTFEEFPGARTYFIAFMGTRGRNIGDKMICSAFESLWQLRGRGWMEGHTCFAFKFLYFFVDRDMMLLLLLLFWVTTMIVL